MGGLTGFSSLADGYLRLDPSGRGRPDDEFFNQPITSNDHPFLRQYAQLDGPEAAKALRQPGESEMDYYERRYQERMKAEKTMKPKPIQGSPFDTNAKLSTGQRKTK